MQRVAVDGMRNIRVNLGLAVPATWGARGLPYPTTCRYAQLMWGIGLPMQEAPGLPLGYATRRDKCGPVQRNHLGQRKAS